MNPLITDKDWQRLSDLSRRKQHAPVTLHHLGDAIYACLIDCWRNFTVVVKRPVKGGMNPNGHRGPAFFVPFAGVHEALPLRHKPEEDFLKLGGDVIAHPYGAVPQVQLRHNSSPSVGAPFGAGLNNHEPTDGDTGPAGDPLQSPAGSPTESSPAVQAGAGKGGAQLPPNAAASAVRPGEVPPIASPGQHGKQFLIEPDPTRPGFFNTDCGRCGEGRTLDPNSLVLFLSVHDCKEE